MASSKYDVPSLLKLCVSYTKKTLKVENVVRWLTVATKTNTETLKSHCLEFVAKHLDEVQDTDDWDALMRDKQMLGEVAPLLFQTIQTLMRSRAAVAQHGTASHY